jgi:CRP-like cAMP-binding protein
VGIGLLDRVLTLQRVPLFSALDPEELHLVARSATKISHAAGDVVFREGEGGDVMIIITVGSVDIRTGDSVVAVRRAGEFVGELSILRGKARMADVIAGNSGVSGLVVGSEALRGLVAERPEAASAMLTTLADRIAELLPDSTPA